MAELKNFTGLLLKIPLKTINIAVLDYFRNTLGDELSLVYENGVYSYTNNLTVRIPKRMDPNEFLMREAALYIHKLQKLIYDEVLGNGELSLIHKGKQINNISPLSDVSHMIEEHMAEGEPKIGEFYYKDGELQLMT